MFRVVNDMGFQIELNNGYTISVMFSPRHYCSNIDFDRTDGCIESRNAEIAIRDTVTGAFIPIHNEDVDGYRTVENFFSLINDVQDYPNTDSKMNEVIEQNDFFPYMKKWVGHSPEAEDCYCEGCTASDYRNASANVLQLKEDSN